MCIRNISVYIDRVSPCPKSHEAGLTLINLKLWHSNCEGGYEIDGISWTREDLNIANEIKGSEEST